MSKRIDPRAPTELQLITGLLLAAFLCLGQQVSLPQCPQFAGSPQLSASCITSIADIAFDAAGTGWIADNTGYTPGRVLRFPGIRVGQAPSSNQTADLVLGKPDFSSLSNGSCQTCAMDRPVKLAFDDRGALWVADLPSPDKQGAPAKLHRFSPPFTNGQAADLVLSGDGTGGMVFDASGNLWIASLYSCGHVLEYSSPFSAAMQPTIVLGQPSPVSCVATPGPNVLNSVQGLAFGPDGSLYVGDIASHRVAVFRPPFQTFMNAAIVIGQANLTSYQPVPFGSGGFGDIEDLAIDSTGKLVVLSDNSQHVSLYSPPFSTGMAKASWFDFVSGQTSNGSSFPYVFNGYTHLRFGPDSSLWFSGTINTLAVLTPSVLQLLQLSPTISIIASSATGTSPFTAGQLISIYGTQLGPSSPSGAQIGPDGAVTKSNSGTQVFFDGVAAPILYTGANQVNTAVPCSLADRSSTQMVVHYLGAQSAPFTVPLSIAAPGIFTVNGSGSGQGAVLNQDYSLNGRSNPARRGSAVMIYATGVPTSPCIDGLIYQSNFPSAVLPVIVGVGNIGAQVLYEGQAPGLITGVAQINIVIPNDAPTGAVPLTLLVGGIFSPPGVTVTVK